MPKKFRPSPEWQNLKISEFSELRMRLVRHMALVDKIKKENGEEAQNLPKKPKLPHTHDEKGRTMLECFNNGL